MSVLNGWSNSWIFRALPIAAAAGLLSCAEVGETTGPDDAQKSALAGGSRLTADIGAAFDAAVADARLAALADATRSQVADPQTADSPGVLGVPDRVAGPAAPAQPWVVPYRADSGTAAGFADGSPMDWPVTEALSESLAARQRVVDPEGAAHPDAGFRVPTDPEGSFEVLSQRTQTSRILELTGGRRLYVAFPDAAFDADDKGWLRNNVFRFSADRGTVSMAAQSGAGAVLPANISAGVVVTTGRESEPTTVLGGLSVVAEGPRGTTALAVPAARPESFHTSARYWDAAADVGVRLDGIHGGFEWSMTLGANWAASVPADAERVVVAHTVTLPKGASISVDGQMTSGVETCEPVVVIGEAGERVMELGGPRIWDAADAAAGFALSGCPDVVSQRFEQRGERVTVTMTVDAAWLRAADRVFPVVIDPDFTWTGTGQQIFGTVYSSAIYSNVPTNNTAEWGDHDARRGYMAWPLNNFPSDGWALGTDREVTLLGHIQSGQTSYNSSMTSNLEIRLMNFFANGAYRAATYATGNATYGNTLYSQFNSDAWHIEPIGGNPVLPTTWSTACSGTACTNNIVINEVEPNDTYAQARAALLGNQTGPASCSNTCGTSNNGSCQDGGPGYAATGCSFGTDCADCGTRAPINLNFQGNIGVNDVDNFGFQTNYAPAIKIFVETIDGSPCNFDGVLELRWADEVIDHADGVCPSIDTCKDNPAWSCNLLPAGAYGVSFRGYAPFDTGNYRVRVQVDRDPISWNGFWRSRWRIDTSFGDYPVNVLTANHNQSYINEMWKNLSRGTVSTWQTANNNWYMVTERSNKTAYPVFVIDYAQPVAQEPANFQWVNRTTSMIRWEWDHALNARWYQLADANGATIANHLFRFYSVSAGVYRYYVEEQGLTENTCYSRRGRGDNEIGPGPLSPVDKVATLARDPIVPTSATATNGDFTVSTNLNTATLAFSYNLPSRTVTTGCDDVINHTEIQGRLVSCTTGTVMPSTQNGTTGTSLTLTSSEPCAHFEVRYVNMDGIPTSWVRTAFQVFFSAGLQTPSNFRATARGVQSITWGWTDMSTTETRFRLADAANVIKKTVTSTTTAATGGAYTSAETFTTYPDGNIPYTRHARASNTSEEGPNTGDITAWTLPRTARFSSGTNLSWSNTDAIVYDLDPVGGSYRASIVIAEQPNNGQTGCSGAILTRCEMVGGAPTGCVTVSAPTQADAAGNGTCNTPAAANTFDGRGYGDRYDGGAVVIGEGLFTGRNEGLVYDSGLIYGHDYRYTLVYVSGDDFTGASATFDLHVGCCFDPTAAPTYTGTAGACVGVCGQAVQGQFLYCEPPANWTPVESDCDGADNDCDGGIDETAPTWYPDVDGDGYGDAAAALNTCTPPTGYTNVGGDCDDTRPTVNPAALDICDGVDNDCNPASSDGSADGALGEVCDTGVPGLCGPGVSTCGGAGNYSTTFEYDYTFDDWTIFATTNSWRWTAGTPGWDVRGNLNHDVRVIDAPWAINAFRMEAVFQNGDNDQMGLVFDVQDFNDYAFVVVDLGNDDLAGNESVRIGRSTNGSWSNALQWTGISVATNDWVRLVVQMHDGDVQVWVENITTGTGLLYAGEGDVGAATYGSIGLLAHSTDRGWWTSFDANGATLSCASVINPGDIAETCDGVDQDCDGTIDNGFAVGLTCDGTDADSCNDGLSVCNASGTGVTCEDRSPAFILDFDETTGVDAVDNSGAGHDGTLLNGALYTTDARYGDSALELEGNNGYVSVAADIPEDRFTLAAWFRTTATSGGILYATNGATTGATTLNDRRLYVNNGKVGYRVWNGSYSGCNSGPVVNDGQWHQAVLTCAQGEFCSMYVDGNLICNTTTYNLTYSAITEQTHVLIGTSASGGRFPGQLDHVVALPYGMDAAAVSDLYTNGLFAPDQGANNEICDGVDNDCDGTADPGGSGTYYRDVDSDGYGDPSNSASLCATDPSVLGGGWVTNSDDCNDAAYSVHPGAAEIVGNEVDESCDGAELCYVDADRDQARSWTVVASADVMCTTANAEARFDAQIDCLDSDATIFPGAIELCDGLDNDCDGDIDEGFAASVEDLNQPSSSCGVGDQIPTTNRLQTIFNARGEMLNAQLDANIAPETFFPATGDLTFHFVAEGAGYENTFGWYNAGTDVSNPANRFPIFDCAEEPSPSMIRSVNFTTNPNWTGGPIGFFITTPQGRPNNCATNTDYGYAYYTELALNTGDLACTDQPFLHYLVYKSTAYASTYYFGFEDLYRGGDNDFEDVLVMVEGLVGENEWYRDADLDGFGDPNDTVVSCTRPDGYIDNADDCRDFDPGVRPGAPELCDLVDNNCTAGLTDEGEDLDGDGYTTCGGDCDDTDPTRNLSDTDVDGYDTCGSIISGGNPALQSFNAGVIGDSTVRGTSENFGQDVALTVGNSSGVDPARTLIAFDLSGVPDGAHVVKAEMFLYTYTRYDLNAGSIAPVDRNITANRVLANWQEDGVTATTTGVGPDWATTRLGLDDVDASSTSTDQALVLSGATVHPVGWISWDITTDVQAWMDGAPNFGMLLSAVNEATEGFDVRFYSAEYGVAAYRPYLRITWNGTPALEDCEDFDPAIHPDALEICDTIDNDCDGGIDDDDPDGVDNDGDGSSVCDCDDTDPYTYAGAPEVCDYRDNDCNPSTAADNIFNVGLPCDGAGDADSCTDGITICSNDLTTAVCSDGAAAIYRFEEGAAAQVFDWSGSGAATTLRGNAALSTIAKHGNYSISLSGVWSTQAEAGAVRVPLALADGLEFTVGGWARRGSSGERYVVGRTADNGFNGLGFAADGTLWYGNRRYAAVDSQIALTSGTWTHFAITFDRRVLRVYINGQLRRSYSVPVIDQPTEWMSDVWFGQELDANDGGLQASQSFDGLLDDLVWYNHALGDTGVVNLMNANISNDMNAEICDGIDNDCGGGVDDGFTVGAQCDGADPDACNDGIVVCSANGLTSMCGDGAGGLYRFDDSLADGAFDASGGARTGVLSGSAAGASIGGRQAAYLPGDATSAVRIPASAAQAPQFTFSAWVYPTGLSGPDTIANIATQHSVNCSYNGFTLTRDGQLGINCQTVQDPSMAFASNTWTHVAVTFDGVTARVYRNGSSSPAYTWNVCSGSTMSDCATEYRSLQWLSNLWIGQEQDLLNGGFGAARAFEGYVDDVAWFNYALTASQAASLASGFSPLDVNFEFCDFLDNDCQGGADDPYVGLLGNSCTVGVGACAAPGWYVCADDDMGVVCDGTPGTPSPETCDGIDNDCDGSTDEGATGGELAESCYDGPGGTAGIGVCRTGTRTCVDARWGACAGQVLPSEEDCDGLDNDCNGSADFDPGTTTRITDTCYSGPPGTAGVGLCTTGLRTCQASGSWGSCTGEVTPAAETCDGLDNDCDGARDLFHEACYTGPAGTAGVGACEEGERLCTAGAWGSCTGQVTPVGEICSLTGDEDMNCDGAADDNCIEAAVELVGVVSGDPGTDYTQCDVTDGESLLCTYLTVRFSNIGTVALPEDAPVEIRINGSEVLSGPFGLPEAVAPGETLEVAYCFNSERARLNSTITAFIDFGDGNTAQDSLASQSITACGFETCDGFDNDGDGRVDESPEACGSTMQCILADSHDYLCVASLVAEETAPASECAADADCAAGEFCSNGSCVYSGRFDAAELPPTDAAELVATDDEGGEVESGAETTDASGGSSAAGCSAAPSGQPASAFGGLLLVGLALARRRRRAA